MYKDTFNEDSKDNQETTVLCTLALLQNRENLNDLSLSGTTFSIISENCAFFAKMFNQSLGTRMLNNLESGKAASISERSEHCSNAGC